jgi:AAA domain
MSELHSWAKLLGGEVSGVQVLCPGPGHGPQDRSLSVKRAATNGGFVVHSFSGDDPIACKDHVRKLLGKEPFKPRGNGEARSTKRHFDYCGPGGALLYQVEREDLPGSGKKIRQRRPDGNGGWVWNLDGVNPVPYRLPELLEALAHGRTVVIAEGEAKVDLLWSWNVPATCNSGGAGKWRAQHSACLAKGARSAGADVVVLPDNDEPGRRHAEIVAASLMEAGATVRVLDLPGLGPKGDVIDWAAAGGTVEQLHALIEREARPRASSDASNGEAKDAAAPKHFDLIPFELIKFDGAEEWLVKGLLPRQGVAAFFGAKSSFKSFAAQDLNFHIAAGWNWAGRRVEQAAVVYIAAEGSAGLRKRKAGFELYHGERLPERVPFHLISAAPNLGTAKGDLDALIASIVSAGVSPGAVTIDTVSQTLGSAEENGAGMIQLIANAQALSERFGCLVLLLHHAGLTETDRLRGHSSLGCALDALMYFERKEGALAATMTVQKLKDEDDNGLAFDIELVRVVTGKDADGEEISTLVVETVRKADTATAKPAKPVPRQQRLLMTVVDAAIDEAGFDFKPFAAGPVVRAVPESVVRERYYARIAEPKDNEDERKAYNRKHHAWKRQLKSAIDAKALMAALKDGERAIWKP